jgi:transcriptional regulator with XRE-family HTH domain
MLRLREIREAQEPRLTQAALAYKAGVSERTVRRAEELGTASLESVQRLAAALDCSVDDLFSPDGERVA